MEAIIIDNFYSTMLWPALAWIFVDLLLGLCDTLLGESILFKSVNMAEQLNTKINNDYCFLGRAPNKTVTIMLFPEK